jgi:hypothetical protein
MIFKKTYPEEMLKYYRWTIILYVLKDQFVSLYDTVNYSDFVLHIIFIFCTKVYYNYIKLMRIFCLEQKKKKSSDSLFIY